MAQVITNPNASSGGASGSEQKDERTAPKHLVQGLSGETVVLTAANLADGPIVTILECTDTEVELAAAEVHSVILSGCTGCTIKVSVGTKIVSETVTMNGCTGSGVKSAVKINTIEVVGCETTTITVNNPEQLGRVEHEGTSNVIFSCVNSPEYNVEQTKESLLAIAAAVQAPLSDPLKFVTRFFDEEIVTEEADELDRKETAAAEAKKPKRSAAATEKAEALKSAKKALGEGKASEGVEHSIVGKEGEIITIGPELPNKAVVWLKECNDCRINFLEDAVLVKLMIHKCTGCRIHLAKGVKIATSIVEMWECIGTELDTDIKLGTLQIDVSKEVTIGFASTEELGQLVQAGVSNLTLKFGGDGGPEHNKVLTDEVLQVLAPGLLPGDKTTQFTTRLVDGVVLTEEIIRLANDYPTTAREKAKHDKDIQAKDEALTEMAEKLLGAEGVLPESTKIEIKAKVKSQKDKLQSELETDSGPEARVEYKKRLGNDMFKAKDYTQAAVHYTEAIQIKDDIPAIYSNRCMCFLKMGQADRALVDADKCIELDPKYVKAHFRRGVALLELGELVESLKAFRRTLDLDPKNSQAKASMALAEKKLSMTRR